MSEVASAEPKERITQKVVHKDGHEEVLKNPGFPAFSLDQKRFYAAIKAQEAINAGAKIDDAVKVAEEAILAQERPMEEREGPDVQALAREYLVNVCLLGNGQHFDELPNARLTRIAALIDVSIRPYPEWLEIVKNLK